MAKTQDTKNKSANGSDTGSSLPLFYKSPALLDVQHHKMSTVRTDNNFSFAVSTNSVPVNAIEFIELSRHYPIVFTENENAAPVAVVGMEKTNYFVDDKSAWAQDRYIPAYVRQYPFVMMESKQDDKFYLCVDESSDKFSLNGIKIAEAQRIYSDDGQPSEFAKNILEFCTSYYRHFLLTQNLCNDLRKHKLLVPYKSDATLANGRKVTLGGFLMIDEKAFNELPEKTFLEFREKGWLPFIYFALASASNWKRIVDLASQAEPSVAA